MVVVQGRRRRRERTLAMRTPGSITTPARPANPNPPAIAPKTHTINTDRKEKKRGRGGGGGERGGGRSGGREEGPLQLTGAVFKGVFALSPSASSTNGIVVNSWKNLKLSLSIPGKLLN